MSDYHQTNHEYVTLVPCQYYMWYEFFLKHQTATQSRIMKKTPDSNIMKSKQNGFLSNEDLIEKAQ